MRTIDVTLSREIIIADGTEAPIAIVRRFKKLKLTYMALLGKDYSR